MRELFTRTEFTDLAGNAVPAVERAVESMASAAEEVVSALSPLLHVLGSALWSVSGFVHGIIAGIVSPVRAFEASLLTSLGVSYPDGWLLYVYLMLALFAAYMLTPDFFELKGFTGYIIYDKYLFAIGVLPLSLIAASLAFRLVFSSITGYSIPGVLWDCWGGIVLFVAGLYFYIALIDEYGVSKKEWVESLKRANVRTFKIHVTAVGPILFTILFNSILAGAVMWVIAFALSRFELVAGYSGNSRRLGAVISHPCHYLNGKFRVFPRMDEICTGVNLGGYLFPLAIGLYGIYEMKQFLVHPQVATVFSLYTLSIFVATLLAADVKSDRILAEPYFIPAFASLYGFATVMAAITAGELPHLHALADAGKAVFLRGCAEYLHYAAIATFSMMSISYAIAGDILPSIIARFRGNGVNGVYGGMCECDAVIMDPMLGVSLGPLMLWSLGIPLYVLACAAMSPVTMAVGLMAAPLLLIFWPIIIPWLYIMAFFPEIIGKSEMLPPSEMLVFTMLLLVIAAGLPAAWYRVARPYVRALIAMFPYMVAVYILGYVIGLSVNVDVLPPKLMGLQAVVFALPVVTAIGVIKDRKRRQTYREKYGWEPESDLY